MSHRGLSRGRGRGLSWGRGWGGGRGGGGQQSFREGPIPRPNPDVTNVEDAIVEDSSRTFASLSIDGQCTLPLRPSYGKVGRPIVLWTNYFDLKCVAEEAILHRYTVTIQSDSPEKKLPKPKKKRLIQLLLQKAPFSTARVASDWAQSLVSAKELNFSTNPPVYDIEWYPEGGDPPKADDDKVRRKGNTFRLLVGRQGPVSLNDLLADLKKTNSNQPLRLEIIQALNIVLGSGPSSDSQVAVAGTNRFFPFGSHPQFEWIDLKGGLLAYRGYYTSVRTGANRVLVNVNVATGAFYKSGCLLDVLQEIRGNDSAVDYAKMAAFVRKLRFETSYLCQTTKQGKKVTKRKVHAIFDLSPWGKNSMNTSFKGNDGKLITVKEHFQKAYGIKLEKPGAPLVNYSNQSTPMWIPAELCTVLGGQMARRDLQGDQTKKMIEFAARKSHENRTSIEQDGLQVAKLNPNAHLNGFNMEVTPKLLTVHGRILAAPTLEYKGTRFRPTNGSWNLRPEVVGEKPFKIVKPLGALDCIVISSGSQEPINGGINSTKRILSTFHKVLHGFDLKPGPIQEPVEIRIEPRQLIVRDVEAVKREIRVGILQHLRKPNFLLFILPSDNAVLYDCIKSVCDLDLGVPSLCSIGRKFEKDRNIQYFANLALKINQKLGGINHGVALKDLTPLDASTVLFGIDVTHPSPGSAEKSPSIAGVVASIDDSFSQYPASMRAQEGRKETVTDLKEMIKERLKCWSTRNGRFPRKVIVFRDGVSEGQYSIVMRDEYPHFVEAFRELYGSPEKHPKVSIIVVGKRHHTRFYPTCIQDMDTHSKNALPGTVVDRGVTDESLFDFFLLAHQGIQGTSKPAHYVVLKDDNKFGADQLQSLTHNLCYTFARATRAVSICPPVYYADLLCERGRCYLSAVLKGGDSAVDYDKNSQWSKNVHKHLENTMYYL